MRSVSTAPGSPSSPGSARPRTPSSWAPPSSERLTPLILDVTDAGQVEAAAAAVAEASGGRLAGLVNNAGITVPGPVETLALDDLRHQLEVNVVGQVAITQAVLPQIRAARGRIVLISSIGDRGGIAFLSAYNASKAAISAIGDGLRQELKPFGVDVSIVEPGSIATEIWDKGDRAAPALRAAMNPEQLELYGDRLERVVAFGRKTGAAGLPPEEVFEVVEHALTADETEVALRGRPRGADPDDRPRAAHRPRLRPPGRAPDRRRLTASPGRGR